MTKASRGIVYVATGRKFVDEVLLSAKSAKNHMPDIPVCLFTDVREIANNLPAGIDTACLLEEVTRSCRDKIRPLADSPYERTLFLDTDTYICAPLYDVFFLLDRFDMALAHAPDRCQYYLPELPECFAELNSGVIAFRKNDRTQATLARWEETFLKMLAHDISSYRDQHSLRDTLFRSDIRLFILPPEYNFRTIGPNFAGRRSKVKILHGRHADLERVAKRLNRSPDRARVFLSSPIRIFSQELSSYESLPETVMNTAFQSLPEKIRTWLSNVRHRRSA